MELADSIIVLFESVFFLLLYWNHQEEEIPIRCSDFKDRPLRMFVSELPPSLLRSCFGAIFLSTFQV